MHPPSALHKLDTNPYAMYSRPGTWFDKEEKELEELYFSEYHRKTTIVRNILLSSQDKHVIEAVAKTLTTLPSKQHPPFLTCDIYLIIAARPTNFDCVKINFQEVETCVEFQPCTKTKRKRKRVLCDVLLDVLSDIVLSYHVNTVRFHVGLYLDVLDDVNCWCISKIISLVRVGDLAFAQIRYLNWGAKFDEWIPCNSPRIRVLIDPQGRLVKKCEFVVAQYGPDKLVQLHETRTGKWQTILNSHILVSRYRLQIVDAGTFMELDTKGPSSP